VKDSVAPVSPGAGSKLKLPSGFMWTVPTPASVQSKVGPVLSVQAPTVIEVTVKLSFSTGSASLSSTPKPEPVVSRA
jgi:hypothetical protein